MISTPVPLPVERAIAKLGNDISLTLMDDKLPQRILTPKTPSNGAR